MKKTGFPPKNPNVYHNAVYRLAEYLALRLGRKRFFRWLFSLYYRCAQRALLKAASRLIPEVSRIFIHRGWVRGDWEPGVSDLDFVVTLRNSPAADTAGPALKWNTLYRGLKKFFPVLGEVHLAAENELDFHLDNGDIRVLEFSRTARQLSSGASPAGRLPRPPSGLRLKIDSWNECYHAYVRLAQIFFSRAGNGDFKAGRGIRKSLLDMLRYRLAAAASGKAPVILSRTETESRLDEILPHPSPAAGLLGGTMRRDTPLEALAYALTFLEDYAGDILAEASLHPRNDHAGIDDFEVPGKEISANLNFGITLKEKLGGLFQGAVFDSYFDSYVVAADSIPEHGVRLLLSELRGLAATHPAMQGPIIPLGPVSMKMLSAGLRYDDPYHCSFPAATSALAVKTSGCSGILNSHRRAYWPWKNGNNVALPPEVEAEIEKELFSHFLQTWRTAVVSDSAAAPASIAHACSKAMYYFLKFTAGKAPPRFPMTPLINAFAAARPADAPALGDVLLRDRRQRAEDLDIICRLNKEALAAARSAN